MPPWCRLIVLLTVLSVVGPEAGLAQLNRFIPTDDWTYAYILRLQRRGHLLSLNPTRLPYRRGDVWDALESLDDDALSRAERRWVELLRRELRPVEADEADVVLGVSLQAGSRLINATRLDVLRPLSDSLRFYWWGTWPGFYAEAGPFVAQFDFRQDSYYDRDPDGLDTALRLLLRSENSYLGYHTRIFSASLGRYSHHWAPPGEAATLISDNPRSQDHIALRLGGQRVSVTGFLGELDSSTASGAFSGRVADSVFVETRRRFLAAHRWDLRPFPWLQVAFMESVLYSGANSSVSLKYLNPLHPFSFVVDNIPKNDENNGFVAGLVWAQFRRMTLHGQFMVDDIDARSESDESLSFALTGSLVYAAATLDFGGTLEVVTSRTYNAPQREGTYVYLLRGLATPFSDYVHGALFADVYLDRWLPGLTLTPRLHWLVQGERDLRDPFPPKGTPIDNLLDGVVSRTIRPAMQVSYQRSPWWWIRLNAGLNVTQNADHVKAADETRFVGLAEIGMRIPLDGAFRLSFP